MDLPVRSSISFADTRTPRVTVQMKEIFISEFVRYRVTAEYARHGQLQRQLA